MQTIILPGGSLKNKTWLDECSKNLKVDGVVRPITWEHWLDEDQKFNPREKATVISRHTRGEKVSLIAKSIGTLVASYVILDIPDQIEKVIFNGIPIHDINEGEKAVIAKALSSLDKEKIIIFQNDSDPHGTYEEAKELVPEGVNILSKPRSDHDYPYYDEFNSFLLK